MQPGQVVPALTVNLDVYHSSGVTDVKFSHAMLPAGDEHLVGSTDPVAAGEMGVLDAKVVIPGPGGRTEAALAAA